MKLAIIVLGCFIASLNAAPNNAALDDIDPYYADVQMDTPLMSEDVEYEVEDISDAKVDAEDPAEVKAGVNKSAMAAKFAKLAKGYKSRMAAKFAKFAKLAEAARANKSAMAAMAAIAAKFEKFEKTVLKAKPKKNLPELMKNTYELLKVEELIFKKKKRQAMEELAFVKGQKKFSKNIEKQLLDLFTFENFKLKTELMAIMQRWEAYKKKATMKIYTLKNMHGKEVKAEIKYAKGKKAAPDAART